MPRLLALCFPLLASTVLCAQTPLPLVAPGLSIPSGSGGVPLALDRYDGTPELVPIHHSTVEVNNHTGANVAGSLAGSIFYKPKMTTELPGQHARAALHDLRPSFYIHVERDPDSSGDSDRSDTAVWTVVQASVVKDHRVFAKVQFTQLTGKAKRTDGIVNCETEALPGGWTKITPTTPLASGEYALTPILKTPNTFSTVVYDFTLDPAAANAADAVLPNP